MVLWFHCLKGQLSRWIYKSLLILNALTVRKDHDFMVSPFLSLLPNLAILLSVTLGPVNRQCDLPGITWYSATGESSCSKQLFGNFSSGNKFVAEKSNIMTFHKDDRLQNSVLSLQVRGVCGTLELHAKLLVLCPLGSYVPQGAFHSLFYHCA